MLQPKFDQFNLNLTNVVNVYYTRKQSNYKYFAKRYKNSE